LIFRKIVGLAWCLKNESVHCVLLGASSVEQLYENINSLHVKKTFYFYFFQNTDFFYHVKVVSKLTPSIMTDIDRILGNKPSIQLSTKNETVQPQQIQR